MSRFGSTHEVPHRLRRERRSRPVARCDGLGGFRPEGSGVSPRGGDGGRADLRLLASRLAEILEPKACGSVRLYRVCQQCLAASFGLGSVTPGLGDEPCVSV